MINDSMAKPNTTCCVAGAEFGASPMPRILEWEWSDGELSKPPRMWTNYAEGTRYTCPTCSTVYVCTWVPDQVGNGWVRCARWEWRVETLLQKLQRKRHKPDDNMQVFDLQDTTSDHFDSKSRFVAWLKSAYRSFK